VFSPSAQEIKPRPDAYRQIVIPAHQPVAETPPPLNAKRRSISPPLRTIPDLAAQYEATILDFRLAWLLFVPVADRAVLWTIHGRLLNQHLQTNGAMFIIRRMAESRKKSSLP
jgi:hypothetical protein